MKLRILPVIAMLLALPCVAGSLEEAETLIDAGQYDRAVRVLERSLGDTTLKPAALILLTRIANRQGDYEEGIRQGKQAIKVAPENSEAHLEYARAIRIKMQKVSKVKAMFSLGTYKKELKRAIELDPKNVEARSEEIGFLVHAPGFAGGDKERARERIVELEPLDWREAQWHRADIYANEENFDGRLAIYEAMLERDPEDVGARQQLAYTLLSLERYRAADREFGVLAESDDSRQVLAARYQMAKCRILGRYEIEDAVRQLLAYIDELPDSIEGLPGKTYAYWRLGMAYERLERIADARSAYSRSISLDSGNGEARKALKRLPSS